MVSYPEISGVGTPWLRIWIPKDPASDSGIIHFRKLNGWRAPKIMEVWKRWAVPALNMAILGIFSLDFWGCKRLLGPLCSLNCQTFGVVVILLMVQKSGHQLRLAVYPIIYVRILYILSVVGLGVSEPSSSSSSNPFQSCYWSCHTGLGRTETFSQQKNNSKDLNP